MSFIRVVIKMVNSVILDPEYLQILILDGGEDQILKATDITQEELEIWAINNGYERCMECLQWKPQLRMLEGLCEGCFECDKLDNEFLLEEGD